MRKNSPACYYDNDRFHHLVISSHFAEYQYSVKCRMQDAQSRSAELVTPNLAPRVGLYHRLGFLSSRSPLVGTTHLRMGGWFSCEEAPMVVGWFTRAGWTAKNPRVKNAGLTCTPAGGSKGSGSREWPRRFPNKPCRCARRLRLCARDEGSLHLWRHSSPFRSQSSPLPTGINVWAMVLAGACPKSTCDRHVHMRVPRGSHCTY